MMPDPEFSSCRSFIEKELTFSCADTREEAWRRALIERINDLILYDFERLVLVLYRLDIDESKLENLLNDNSSSDEGGAASVICHLIIERQMEKIKSRKQFGRDKNISEEEKW